MRAFLLSLVCATVLASVALIPTAEAASVRWFGFNDAFTAAGDPYFKTWRDVQNGRAAVASAQQSVSAKTAALEAEKVRRSQIRGQVDSLITQQAQLKKPGQARRQKLLKRADTRRERRKALRRWHAELVAYEDARETLASQIDKANDRLAGAGGRVNTAAAELGKAQEFYNWAKQASDTAAATWTQAQAFESWRLDLLLYYPKLAGANTSRMALHWAQVEPASGQFDWSYYDMVYNRFLTNGLRPSIVLMNAPCWAHPSIGCPRGYKSLRPDPSYMSYWSRFVAEATRRYPQALAIEVWNEPNDPMFWGPDASAPAYMELLRVAHQAIKSVNVWMPVATAGLNPYAHLPADGANWEQMLNRMYTQGAGSVSDILGLHPYPKSDPVTASVIAQFDAAKAIRNSVGISDPIWVTEIGLSTDPGAGAVAVTPHNQAVRLLEIHNYLVARGMDAMIVHRIFDGNYNSAWENGSGVVDRNGRGKPAFCILALLRGRYVC